MKRVNKKINHHYIPRVYLKYWEDDSQKIWLYNIKDRTVSHRNKNSVFKEDYLYSLTIREFDFLTAEQKELFVQPLLQYKIFLNDIELNCQEIVANLQQYDKFVIKKMDGSIIKQKHKKALLDKILNGKHPLIEDRYGEEIENSWDEVAEFFEKYRLMILSNNIILPTAQEIKEIADRLLNFILSMYTRNPFNMLQSIERIQERHNIEIANEAVRTTFETIQLLFLNGKRFLFDMKRFDIHLIFAPQGSFFITTDNPVFFRGIEIENIGFTGLIWFPLTPQILVSLSKKETQDSLNIKHYIATEETVKEFNGKIYENIVECFVAPVKIEDIETIGYRQIDN